MSLRATARLRGWKPASQQFRAQARRSYHEEGHPHGQYSADIEVLTSTHVCITLHGGKSLVVNEIIEFCAGSHLLGSAEVICLLDATELPWEAVDFLADPRLPPKKVKGT